MTAVSEAFGAVAESYHSNTFEATTDFTGRNMAVKHQSHSLDVERPGIGMDVHTMYVMIGMAFITTVTDGPMCRCSHSMKSVIFSQRYS